MRKSFFDSLPTPRFYLDSSTDTALAGIAGNTRILLKLQQPKARGLIIDNDEVALSQLRSIGYYRLDGNGSDVAR